MSGGTITNQQADRALVAATELSKIGSTRKDARLRVARMIRWLRSAVDRYQSERDMLLAGLAKRDDAGEIEVEVSEDGKTHRALMRNEAEAQLAFRKLERDPAVGDGDMPEPLSWDQLDEWFVVKGHPAVSPDLAARLGPFVTL